jgi:EF hand
VRVLLPALLLPFLAAAADVPDTSPVVVTGHAWAPFISPMGEPFRAHSPTDDTLADWFAKADRNHDGYLTVDEMQADAERFYSALDADHNGEIDPDELANYEYEIAPDVQVMSKTRLAPGAIAPRPVHEDADASRSEHRRKRRRDEDDFSSLAMGDGFQGAARYGLLNIPEPVAAADTNFDRGISLAEFKEAAIARFALLDRGHSGRLSLQQLEALRPVITADGRRKRPKDVPDARVGNPLPSEN